MATHSSVLAWRIPGMVEPGGLSSMGSHRVGHDWSDLAAAAAGSGLFNPLPPEMRVPQDFRLITSVKVYSSPPSPLLLNLHTHPQLFHPFQGLKDNLHARVSDYLTKAQSSLSIFNPALQLQLYCNWLHYNQCTSITLQSIPNILLRYSAAIFIWIGKNWFISILPTHSLPPILAWFSSSSH